MEMLIYYLRTWLAGGLMGLLLFMPSLVEGSSHREAPLIANDPLAGNTRTPTRSEVLTILIL